LISLLRILISDGDRQKLSPELDGIYGIMDFDLRYEDEKQLRTAAALLEEMNKQGWNQSLRQVSANEYYGLLKDVENSEPPFQKTNESKKPKTSDKMLFESWRRYLGK
jgi:hypothetical protein